MFGSMITDVAGTYGSTIFGGGTVCRAEGGGIDVSNEGAAGLYAGTAPTESARITASFPWSYLH